MWNLWETLENRGIEKKVWFQKCRLILDGGTLKDVGNVMQYLRGYCAVAAFLMD